MLNLGHPLQGRKMLLVARQGCRQRLEKMMAICPKSCCRRLDLKMFSKFDFERLIFSWLMTKGIWRCSKERRVVMFR